MGSKKYRKGNILSSKPKHRAGPYLFGIGGVGINSGFALEEHELVK